MKKKRNIPEGLEKYIKEEDGKISIDWKSLQPFKNCRSELFRGLYDNALEFLRQTGILIFPKQGSIYPFGGMIDLSPTSTHGSYYHFAHETDLELYLKTVYGNAQFPISIKTML